MVLRTNSKAFKVVVSEKNFFQKFEIFWLFCISGVTDFLKNDQLLFLRDTDLKFVVDCTNGVANEFQGVLGRFKRKKKFSKVASFFTFFAYPGSQIFWKMTNYFFERYGREIFRGLHKWCCERILRRFRSFWGKKIFFEGCSFFFFFCISGVTDFLKMTNFFFERYWPEIRRGLHKWRCEKILRRFRLFRAKKFFFENSRFLWLFLHIRGHRFLEKWPTSFLRDTDRKFVVDWTNGVANKF